jgi:predicted  nucleic acid-binding Zn-ribbon protein
LENKLRQLYALQMIDSSLDELQELKGDLPAHIGGLESRKAQLTAAMAELDQTMRTAFAQRDTTDGEIVALRDKMEKYKTQQFEVRNNKEYDALTKEMDHASEMIARLEKEMDVLEGKATLARTDIEGIKAQLVELEKELDEKHAALTEVSKATEEEELKYSHQREKLLVRINKADLLAYERIRKAKKGKAVVPVKRGACGGCFARVPPQKLLELRQNKRLYACEHCGRILVSDQIVEESSSIV